VRYPLKIGDDMDKIDKTTHENSLKFLRSVFLTCPINGDRGYIDKIEKDHFVVKCKKTQWKISFKIEECG